MNEILNIVWDWFGTYLTRDEIQDLSQELEQKYKAHKIKNCDDILNIATGYLCYQSDDGEFDAFAEEIWDCLEKYYHPCPSVRDIVLSDFEYQLENTNFNDEEDCDNSYQYMMIQLDIHYREKDASDTSLTLLDCVTIVETLNNIEQLTLKQAYENIIEFLKSKED